MDWWREPGVWIFMFAAAFFVMLSEWFKAHNIIDNLKGDSNEVIKEMKYQYWKKVTELEWENQELKERLGR